VAEVPLLDLALDDAPLQRRSRKSREEPRVELPEIVVVEREPVPDLLSDHLAEGGFMVTPVPDSLSCLDIIATRTPSAIVLDIEVASGTGLDLLRSLKAWQCPSPVVVVARRADLRTAIEAMKCGALDVFERPQQIDGLIACLRNAVRPPQPAKPARPPRLKAFPGREKLTRREREVLVQVQAGASNKEAGRVLDISPRTVEVHRARIMEKLGARNAADLVRIVMSLDKG
jgi:two-component system, LuxR family, response regulator FixJ